MITLYVNVSSKRCWLLHIYIIEWIIFEQYIANTPGTVLRRFQFMTTTTTLNDDATKSSIFPSDGIVEILFDNRAHIFINVDGQTVRAGHC